MTLKDGTDLAPTNTGACKLLRCFGMALLTSRVSLRVIALARAGNVCRVVIKCLVHVAVPCMASINQGTANCRQQQTREPTFE